VVVSLTLFLPICLEQFARDNGKLLPDRVHPCIAPRGTPTTNSGGDEARCAVKLGWAWIDSASFRCARLLVYVSTVLIPRAVFTCTLLLSLSKPSL
jgi:hypothetical protein